MIFFGILGHLANIDSQIHAFSIPSNCRGKYWRVNLAEKRQKLPDYFPVTTLMVMRVLLCDPGSGSGAHQACRDARVM